MAHIELFILNYKGEHFLPACLEKVGALERGSHTLEVTVIDNNSGDNSEQLVQDFFPWVHYKKNADNYGFSRGNNEGVWWRKRELAKKGKTADFYVFLNNDTEVDKNWLITALAAFDNAPQRGLVGSKSLFSDHFAALHIQTSDSFVPATYEGTDTRDLAAHITWPLELTNIKPALQRSRFLGAYDVEHAGRWLKKEASFLLAVADPKKEVTGSFSLLQHHPENKSIEVTLTLITPRGKQSSKRILAPNVPSPYTFTVQPNEFVRVIQNAGSWVNSEGDAGDRAHCVIDTGTFDTPATVDAVCGVSLFIRAALFDQLKGFDERFFMYFEDTDLSLRARLLGYECYYEPRSVLYHVHCGAGGGEGSEHFNQQVAYSHLWFRSRYVRTPTWRKVLQEYRKYARPQFAVFERDFSLTQKPQLRALCKYVKEYPYFLKNRLAVKLLNKGKILTTKSSVGGEKQVGNSAAH